MFYLRTPCRTRQCDAGKRSWAGASGCREASEGFVTQHTPIFHWMRLLRRKPPLSWYETRDVQPSLLPYVGAMGLADPPQSYANDEDGMSIELHPGAERFFRSQAK